jgi:hypothetical protein
MRTRSKPLDQLTIVHPNAAGLDIGAREIWACVSPNRTDALVERFGTFTPDLTRLADWLVKHQVETVAMETFGRGVLDTDIRDAGSAWATSAFGQRLAPETCARAQVRLSGLSVDSEVTWSELTERVVSTRCGNSCFAWLPPSPRTTLRPSVARLIFCISRKPCSL